MSRSIRKGPNVDVKLMRKVLRQREAGGHEPIRTWRRACTIVPEFVGHSFLVHNGRDFDRVYVTENMVGHKLGEFAATRKFRAHGGRSTAAVEGAVAGDVKTTTITTTTTTAASPKTE